MLPPVAMLAEQLRRKGTTTRFAAYDTVSIRTITVGTSFSSLCGHAIGYHGEWKWELEVAGRVDDISFTVFWLNGATGRQKNGSAWPSTRSHHQIKHGSRRSIIAT